MQSIPLLDLMSEQIAKQCGENSAAAQAEAKRIAGEARLHRDAQRAGRLTALAVELDEAVKRTRERAESEAYMQTLTTKDKIADEIIAAAGAELARRSQQEGFGAVIEALLAELITEVKQRNGGIDGAALTVLAPSAHADLCRSWLSSHGHGALQVEATPGLADGVAIQDARPSFRVTNTLSSRLSNREDELRKLCLQRLFPQAMGAAGEGGA